MTTDERIGQSLLQRTLPEIISPAYRRAPSGAAAAPALSVPWMLALPIVGQSVGLSTTYPMNGEYIYGWYIDEVDPWGAGVFCPSRTRDAENVYRPTVLVGGNWWGNGRSWPFPCVRAPIWVWPNPNPEHQDPAEYLCEPLTSPAQTAEITAAGLGSCGQTSRVRMLSAGQYCSAEITVSPPGQWPASGHIAYPLHSVGDRIIIVPVISGSEADVHWSDATPMIPVRTTDPGSHTWYDVFWIAEGANKRLSACKPWSP